MTDVIATKDAMPLLKVSSTPAKVKSSPVMEISSSAVYGARAMSSVIRKMGFA